MTQRSRPFFFNVENTLPEVEKTRTGAHPRGAPVGIPVNAFAPSEFENENFKGRVLLIHETGSEPGQEKEAWGHERSTSNSLRGVELQIQGRFKKPCSSILWCAGELEAPLKLGWFMNQLAGLVLKFIKVKQPLFYACLGNKEELPHLCFPVGTVWSFVATPDGQQPPRLGSPELAAVKFQPQPFHPDTEHTYTIFFKTPWVDLCSWELINVPAVSPLPLENGLGEARTMKMLFYDLGTAKTHPNCRQGALIEFVMTRGAKGETWLEDLTDQTLDDTPLDDASDASSEEELDEEGEAVVRAESERHSEAGSVHTDEKESEAGSDTDSNEDLHGEDEDLRAEDEICAEAQSHAEFDAWRPQEEVMLALDRGGEVRVPWYIEAVNRRRRWRVRVWFVFAVGRPGDALQWYHAKETQQLKSLCASWPRSRTFKRGAAYGCYGVPVLEAMRQSVSKDLAPSTFLHDALVRAAATDAGEDALVGALGGVKSLSRPGMSVPRPGKQRKAMLPPRFLVSAGSRACGLAFAHAREGRNTLVREGLVGAIHCEGRLCEEWMRLTSDGTLLCFTPYHCDTPRLRLELKQVLSIEPVQGLFLGRFYLWEVVTELRILIFCSAQREDRDAWVVSLEPRVSEASHSTVDTGTAAHRRPQVRWPMSGDHATMLMDATRARRWRNKRRLVLNDRRLFLAEQSIDPLPLAVVEGMLEKVLGFPASPRAEDVVDFLDLTCSLKAVRFAGWRQEELLAFWLNVYHCLLLHGRLLLGTPKTRRELVRFSERASYLVGTRAVSLSEIEQIILHLPSTKQVTTRAPKTRAHIAGARKLAGACIGCLFPSLLRQGSTARSSDVDTPTFGGCITLACCKPNSEARRKTVSACCFLDRAPEDFSRPEKEARAVLCLNRGSFSCLPIVPVFRATHVEEQLDEMCRRFVEEFLQVDKMKGFLHGSWMMGATLPSCCRALKTAFGFDQQTMLQFLWAFAPEDRGTPSVITRVRFCKYVGRPREREHMTRAVFSSPELNGSLDARWREALTWDPLEGATCGMFSI